MEGYLFYLSSGLRAQTECPASLGTCLHLLSHVPRHVPTQFGLVRFQRCWPSAPLYSSQIDIQYSHAACCLAELCRLELHYVRPRSQNMKNYMLTICTKLVIIIQ
jgi:hypothetical protein